MEGVKITSFSGSFRRFHTIFTQFSEEYILYERSKHGPFGGIGNIKIAKMAAPVRQAWPTRRTARSLFLL